MEVPKKNKKGEYHICELCFVHDEFFSLTETTDNSNEEAN